MTTTTYQLRNPMGINTTDLLPLVDDGSEVIGIEISAIGQTYLVINLYQDNGDNIKWEILIRSSEEYVRNLRDIFEDIRYNSQISFRLIYLEYSFSSNSESINQSLNYIRYRSVAGGVDAEREASLKVTLSTVQDVLTLFGLTSSNTDYYQISKLHPSREFIYDGEDYDMFMSHLGATPEIVATDSDGTERIIPVPAGNPNDPEWTITNLVHIVSETEPTPRGRGDSWFNPATNELRIWTGD